jgi:hypothetical protein
MVRPKFIRFIRFTATVNCSNNISYQFSTVTFMNLHILMYMAPKSLKGQCHEMDTFWWFSRPYKSFSRPYTLLTLYMLLWNYLLILKTLTGNSPHNSLLCDWSMFSCAYPQRLQGKSTRIFFVTQSASGMILKNHRGLAVRIFSVKIAVLGSSKREVFFLISKSFQRNKQEL